MKRQALAKEALQAGILDYRNLARNRAIHSPTEIACWPKSGVGDKDALARWLKRGRREEL